MAVESTASLRNIIVERNPPESKLSELGIKSWPKWGCPPGKYQLKFEAQETCYLLRGRVKVYPKGSPAPPNPNPNPNPTPSSSSSSSSSSVVKFVEFGAGDLVVIPKGLSCTWDVSVAVDKYYKFDDASN